MLSGYLYILMEHKLYYYVIRWVNSVVFYVMVDVKKGMKVAVARPIMSFLTNTIKCTVKIPT